MGAVGGVAILGGNFEAATFPEDKVVQRSLTVGNQEVSDIDAVILDALPLGAPGQLDSHAFLWKGHSHNGSPHTIDWKAFVNVTADDGTGSLWTLQTRIDGAPYTDILTVDDNGLLTVSGATFTMDQLIIDSDNTEAILVRKDGDAGDVFIVDTVNDVVRMGSDATLFTFGAASDVVFRREAAGIIALVDPGSSIASGIQQEMRIQSFDAVGEERYLQLLADRSGNGEAEIRAVRAGGGGQYDLLFDVSVGAIEFFNEGVERWSIQGSVTADFEFMPFITNRYDLGNASFAVRNLYTNGVLIGQDQTAAYDAITIDGTDLAAPGQQDSGAIILTGLSNDGSPHDIDWKTFVNVTANAGTGSIFTIQARIDAASFVDEFTITATTSPTLVNIGPGSTGGAVAFGPSPAQSGTVRLANVDSMVWRNAAGDDDIPVFSFASSDIFDIGDASAPTALAQIRLRSDEVSIPAGRFEIAGGSNSAFRVVDGSADLIFNVDTTNGLVRLVENDTVLTWGTASDAQIHRDAADIIAQRRGLNPQEWRLYDRFVSLSDFDRLAIYIGGGPPLKTIEFVAETSNASQGINIDIEALPGGSSDGRVRLITGTSQFLVEPSRFAMNKVFNLSTASSSGMTMNGFISSLGFGFAPGIAINIDTFGSNQDSHSINMIGSGDGGNRATWKTFVDVIDGDANSIWTLQDDKNGGGFVTNFSITDDGGFNFPLPLPSHAIGAVIDLSSQLTLSGDYFSLLSGGTTASRFKTEDRITGATGQIVGQFQAWFGGNIRTQTATESVANIATVSIDEPQITDQLTGGGTITNAQSLLITGAPTEGVSNYALRIISGDLVVDDTAAILFDLGTDFSALSVAPTGRLEMGLSGTPWSRINFYAPIVTAFGGILRLEATAANHAARTDMETTFVDVATSAGSSVTAASLIPAASFVIGVTVRVLTTVTGPTGFDVGDGIDVDRWGNSILVAAGTVSTIGSFTSGSVTTFQVANDVVITSDGVDFTGGSIRITVHYTRLRTSAA